MTLTAHVERTGERIRHRVIRAYRVNGDLVEFIPLEDKQVGFKYRIAFNGVLTRQYTPRRPSAKVAVFFAEKISNDRYVIVR